MAEFNDLKERFDAATPDQLPPNPGPVCPDEEEEPLDRYGVTIGSKLWGMSSPSWPITPAAYQQGIDNAVPRSSNARGPAAEGLTVRLAPVRDSFFRGQIQKDEQVIDKKRVYIRHKPCSEISPDFCRRFAEQFPKLTHLWDALSKFFKESPVGSYWRLSVEYADGALAAHSICLASRPVGMPPLFAFCSLRGDHLDLVSLPLLPYTGELALVSLPRLTKAPECYCQSLWSPRLRKPQPTESLASAKIRQAWLCRFRRERRIGCVFRSCSLRVVGRALFLGIVGACF